VDEADEADEDEAELVDDADDEVLFFLPLRPVTPGSKRADAVGR